MFDLIFWAIIVGILISLFLIGPVFFLLIETSLTKGWKSAIVLNLGVIFADMICILAAYYSSKDLSNYIQAHPSFYMIGGFFVFIYGFFMIFGKTKLQVENQNLVKEKGFLESFIHGFSLNLLNIGAILFWFFIVSSIAIKYPDSYDFFLYVAIVLLTFFAIDLVKIFIAQKVKRNLTIDRVYMIRRFLGLVLLVFGIIIFLKGFGVFDSISDDIHNQIPL